MGPPGSRSKLVGAIKSNSVLRRFGPEWSAHLFVGHLSVATVHVDPRSPSYRILPRHSPCVRIDTRTHIRRKCHAPILPLHQAWRSQQVREGASLRDLLVGRPCSWGLTVRCLSPVIGFSIPCMRDVPATSDDGRRSALPASPLGVGVPPAT